VAGPLPDHPPIQFRSGGDFSKENVHDRSKRS
jgi:hypothetical protein